MAQKSPLILLTNDDGIFSEGLRVLREGLASLGRVSVVAPILEKSGVSHGITLRNSFTVKAIEREGQFVGYGMDGSPADCVKVAIRELLPEAPDLLLSGINPSSNVGTDILYSGTVAAALEAALAGIPAMSVSSAGGLPESLEDAVALVRSLCARMIESRPPGPLAMNLNFPRGFRRGTQVVIARQSTSGFDDYYERQNESPGELVFRLDKSRRRPESDPETDVAALRAGMVSLTPLFWDLTYRGSLGPIREWLRLDSLAC